MLKHEFPATASPVQLAAIRAFFLDPTDVYIRPEQEAILGRYVPDISSAMGVRPHQVVAREKVAEFLLTCVPPTLVGFALEGTTSPLSLATITLALPQWMVDLIGRVSDAAGHSMSEAVSLLIVEAVFDGGVSSAWTSENTPSYDVESRNQDSVPDGGISMTTETTPAPENSCHCHVCHCEHAGPGVCDYCRSGEHCEDLRINHQSPPTPAPLTDEEIASEVREAMHMLEDVPYAPQPGPGMREAARMTMRWHATIESLKLEAKEARRSANEQRAVAQSLLSQRNEAQKDQIEIREALQMTEDEDDYIGALQNLARSNLDLRAEIARLRSRVMSEERIAKVVALITRDCGCGVPGCSSGRAAADAIREVLGDSK